MWLIVGQMPIKAGWWDSSLALWDSRQSNKHCIQLSTINTIYISCFLYCKIHFQKQLSSVHRCFLCHRSFLWILWNFKENFFSQNTYSGCFWHLHQLRSPILILYVINQKLRREYVQFLSMVEQKEFIFTCIFLRIVTISLSSFKYKCDIVFSGFLLLDQSLIPEKQSCI